MTYHYRGQDLLLKKIEVGSMENNTYVVECPETQEALIVDGCFEPDVIAAAAEGTSVVAIVQTHGHMDHVQALPALKERLSVPVHAHPAESYPVAIDVEMKDGDVIRFGNRAAKVLYTPGHAPGAICLLTGKHLISGDTLFPGGPGNTWGRRDLFDQIMDNIERKLFSLPDDTVVYPGHGADTTIGQERPHLKEWRARGW